MAEQEGPPKQVVTIKKYANRRLYNTASSSYVTLDHLAQMVKDGTDFVVFDALLHHLREMFERDVAGRGGVVEPPVRVLLDDDTFSRLRRARRSGFRHP